MSDLRIQEARRAWEARPGDVQAQGAYLLELLRAGQLAAERLELAAYCGHRAAREALGPKVVKHVRGEVCCCGSESDCAEHGYYGVEGYTHNFVHACDYYKVECECEVSVEIEEKPREWADRASLSAWLAGLSRWGKEATDRAAVAAARVAAEQSAMCPTGGGAWHAAPHGGCFCGYGWDAHRNPDKNPRLHDAIRAIEAAEAYLACPGEERWTRSGEALWTAWHEAYVNAGHLAWLPFPVGRLPGQTHGADHNCEVPQHAARLPAGEAPVGEAIQRALIAWALGDARG